MIDAAEIADAAVNEAECRSGCAGVSGWPRRRLYLPISHDCVSASSSSTSSCASPAAAYRAAAPISTTAAPDATAASSSSATTSSIAYGHSVTDRRRRRLFLGRSFSSRFWVPDRRLPPIGLVARLMHRRDRSHSRHKQRSCRHFDSVVKKVRHSRPAHLRVEQSCITRADRASLCSQVTACHYFGDG